MFFFQNFVENWKIIPDLFAAFGLKEAVNDQVSIFFTRCFFLPNSVQKRQYFNIRFYKKIRQR